MDRNRTKLLRFALSTAICAVPAVSIAARAQDQAPPPEHKQAERDKKQTAQEEGKKNRPTETRTSNHAAQSQAPERRDHSAETQPRNGSAERQAQERQNRPAEERPRNEGASTQNRGAQGGAHRAAPNAHYQFRRQDVPKLRQHFQSQLAHVDRHNRPQVVAGGSLPGSWQTYIVPVPVEVVTYLPPPPEGYELGFYYGYIIVYDPYSGLVLDVIDLLD